MNWRIVAIVLAGGAMLIGVMVWAIAEAIGKVESGGNYSAIGPRTKSGNRAYGKYQVMDFNIGPWTREALGREYSTDQWLASPAAQDATARAKLAQYFVKYWNVKDVASMWFSGRPLSRAGSSADVTGTTVPEYVQRVLDAMA